ncbi:response regulator [Larkinella ripae]
MPPTFEILLIDDDSTILEILNRVAPTSFPTATFTQVATAKEAKDYLHSLEGYGPRLILLDINLDSPETGFDFLTYLRSKRQYNGLPVVMLTISRAPADIRNSYETGANSFAAKPFDLGGWKTLLEALRLYWVETVALPTIYYRKED